MPEKKKIKVKRKKRKLKVKRIIICLLVLISLVLLFLYIKKLPIKNIYIVGNNILSDKEIIEEAGISNYPSFLATSSSTIKKKLLKNNYIKIYNKNKNKNNLELKEEILEKEMYADEGFSEIDEEDQRPETQKVMKQERRQQRKNRRKIL